MFSVDGSKLNVFNSEIIPNLLKFGLGGNFRIYKTHADNNLSTFLQNASTKEKSGINEKIII